MLKFSRSRRFVIGLFFLIVLLNSNAFSSDLLGVVSGTGNMNDTDLTTATNYFVAEAQLRVDYSGWGFLAFNNTFSPHYYHTTTNVWLDDMPTTNAEWAAFDPSVTLPQLIIAQARRASTGQGTPPDPHPFNYKVNGRTLGLAHNGTIRDDGNDFDGATFASELITTEYTNLDLLDRHFGTPGASAIDSEFYGMLMIKNILLADNYGLGDDWAVNRTWFNITESTNITYTSINCLFTDGSKIFALREVEPAYAGTHRLLYDTYTNNMTAVISRDVVPGGWTQINDGTYRVLDENEGIGPSVTLDEDLCEPPTEHEYVISGDHASTTHNSYYPVSAKTADGYYATVWEENGSIQVRVMNQLGLAEQLDLEIISTGGSDPHITGHPDGNIFYVVYSYNNRVYMKQLYYADYYDEGDYYIAEKKWFVGLPYDVSGAPGIGHSYRNPVVACDEDSRQTVVWEDFNGSTDPASYGLKARRVQVNVSQGTTVNLDALFTGNKYRPDIVYVGQNSSDVNFFAVAWAQANSTIANRGVRSLILTAADNNTITQYNAALLDNIESFDPTTPYINAAFPYPKLSKNGGYWLCTYADQTALTNIKLRTRRYKIAWSTTSPNYMLYSTESERLSLLLSYDVEGRGSNLYDEVYSATIYNDTEHHVYVKTHTISKVGVPDPGPDPVEVDDASYPSTSYKPKYPSIAIADWNGVTRRLITWSARPSLSDGYTISANFDPWHFRTGAFKTIGTPAESESDVPLTYQLKGVYPNPFNPTTTIAFSLPNTEKMNISVFNVNGQLVRTLVDGQITAGEYQVIFNGSGLSSGVYFVRMQAGDFVQSKKMILMK